MVAGSPVHSPFSFITGQSFLLSASVSLFLANSTVGQINKIAAGDMLHNHKIMFKTDV